jgi:putative holliday junction resolvase
VHPVLAIDHGTARIGLAATDPLGIAAHPVETIHCDAGDPLERIAEVIAQRGIQHLILGLPLRMDGSEGDAAAKIRAFGAQLRARFPHLPLDYADERLSTVSASEKLRSAGKNARKQKQIIDHAAAVEILNDWLGEQPLDPPRSAEA